VEWPPKTKLHIFEVTKVVADNLKDLDIALGHLGQIIESINAVDEHLRSRVSGEDLDRLQKLRTRVEQSWELYLLLEDVIEEFTERHRATNYGPFRDRVSSLGPFLDSPPGKAWMARISAVFHAFLAHSGSTMDSLLQLANAQTFNPPSWLRGLDGMGGLSGEFKQDRTRFDATEESRALRAVRLLVEKLPALDEIRDYRNFAIHRGTIPISGTVVRTQLGYLDAQATGLVEANEDGKLAVIDPNVSFFGGFDIARFARFSEWHILDVTERVLRVLGEGEGLPPSLRHGV